MSLAIAVIIMGVVMFFLIVAIAAIYLDGKYHQDQINTIKKWAEAHMERHE